MTIIAAYRKNGIAAIGCDEQATGGGSSYFIGRGKKLISRINWIAGVSWSPRVADVIRECEEVKIYIESLADVRKWRDALKNAMNIYAGSPKETNVKNETVEHPFFILLVANGKIYQINNDYSIFEISKYAAVGTGKDAANGAMFAAIDCMSPKEVVSLALRAACRHNIYCGGRIHVMESLSKSN